MHSKMFSLILVNDKFLFYLMSPQNEAKYNASEVNKFQERQKKNPKS